MTTSAPSDDAPPLAPPARAEPNPRADAEGRAVHDLGGLDLPGLIAAGAAPGGAIDRGEHALTLYEKRVDALLMLLVGPKRQLFRVDALRRAVEAYAQQEYDGGAYYDRWVGAIGRLLVEQGVLSEAEIAARYRAIRARAAAAEGGAP